ncbi:UNVERIFIED_CONTAM: Eukaryotic translation initiation factor 2D [Sesamum latifolium]|uniref:Eukaryotic translation initiation factor 2D n=1 Tax=Sesamum latifolium TaxID=2727402 RepID=A0AAW2XQ33_9LAMI
MLTLSSLLFNNSNQSSINTYIDTQILGVGVGVGDPLFSKLPPHSITISAIYNLSQSTKPTSTNHYKMFKKAVEAKSQQRLSGADRKKLKRAIRDRFRNASDAHIDLLLPPKVEITVSKYPNRVLVYGLEGDCPMFYDVDGRGSEIFPTVYALWKVPDLLPAFTLKGGEVSRFVLGGADLMFPGIQIPAEGLPSISAGEPWAVKVPGNPAPIAVGTTTMSSTEALKAGLRGKALRISHHYLDTLWESAENCHVPNAGFLEDVVFEDPALYSASQASDSCQDDTSAGQTNAISNEHIGDSSAADGTPSVLDSASAEDTSVTNEVSEQITAAMVDLQVVEDAAGIESNVDDQHLLSVEDVDALLDKCLLQALHTTVKDKDLPMPGSILWSSHVLPCRPSGITLDIKKSSYKKLSKWLQSKSASGLAHHVVTRGSDSVVRKGALKPLQIVTERRQGNKKVTKLSGLESFLIDAEILASELQKKFACSTTVSELPGDVDILFLHVIVSELCALN